MEHIHEKAVNYNNILYQQSTTKNNLTIFSYIMIESTCGVIH